MSTESAYLTQETKAKWKCRFCGSPTGNPDKVCDSGRCQSELEWEKMVDVVWTYGG